MAEIKPSFPSSLPPQLVITWLPLRDISSALCASSSWRGASEPVFKVVAERGGLKRSRWGADPVVSWREAVLRYSTWAHSEPNTGYYNWRGCRGPRTVTNTIGDRESYFVANSIRVPHGKMATFRVKLEKQDTFNVDGCGFAFLFPSALSIKQAFVWNCDGGDYTGASPRFRALPMEQTRANAFVFESGETLLVTVKTLSVGAICFDQRAENIEPTMARATLERVEKDGTCSTISDHWMRADTYLLPDHSALVVPLVRLCTGSSATLGLYEPLAHE